LTADDSRVDRRGRPRSAAPTTTASSAFERLIEVTPAQERAMGELDRMVRENLTLIDDRIVLATVNEIGQSLVRTSSRSPS
jgi:predicted Zn-dependent protease